MLDAAEEKRGEEPFCDYHAQRIWIYKQGAIRDVTLQKRGKTGNRLPV